MPVRQAMLLAAGLSTRVRPLTDDVPKPLLPFWNKTLLDVTLTYLRKWGIRSVAVNIHHGQEALTAALSKIRDPKITPFIEQPQILGTGGGIRNMRSFVKSKTFVVANCDFISDVNLSAALKFHASRKSIATMLLVRHPQVARYGAIGVDGDGRIVKFPYRNIDGKPNVTGIFSGIHIFDRKIFDHMPFEKVFCINREVYAPLIEGGAPVFGYFSKASWLDVGETKLYAEAQFRLLKKHPAWMKSFLKGFSKKPSGVWISRSAELGKKVRIKGPALISEGVTIEPRAIVGPNVVIGSKARIGQDSRLKNMIVYPKSSVAPSIEVSDLIVTDAAYVPF